MKDGVRSWIFAITCSAPVLLCAVVTHPAAVEHFQVSAKENSWTATKQSTHVFLFQEA